jgi:uncharacterized protein involved in exopolysaccharide biosynthesis
LEAGGRQDASAQGRASAAFSLSELLQLLQRRRKLVIASAGICLLFALAYLSVQVPVYRATAELLVDPQALQVVGKDIVRTDTSASIDFANVDSQALVMTSTGVLRQVIDELNLEKDSAFVRPPGLVSRLLGRLAQPTADQQLAQAVDALKKAIVIQRVDNSLVFRITVSHPQAQKAADIANALAQVYFRQGNDGRRAVVERANSTLIEQIAGLRSQLDTAERAVQAFRSQHSLVSTSEGPIVSQQLRDLYGQISLAEAELARQQARRDQLARYSSRDPLSDTLPEALTSSAVISLRAQYAQSAREAASLAQTLAPQHPRLIEIRAELAETRRLLTGELARLRATVQEGYRQAEANLANLRKRATELTKSQEVSGAAQIRLRQLESEAEAVRVVYSASLQRAKELEQQKRIETNNSRMLSEAVAPANPTKPPAPLVLAAALLFGACAGLGLAYLLEWLPTSRIVPERLKPLTPEAAGLAIGVGTVISLPAAAAQREDALVPVTRLLQKTLGPHLPASVMIAGSVDDATQKALAEHLANSLAAHGESVLLCQDGSGRDMNIRRIEPPATATARPGRRRNFIIMRRTSPSDGKAGARPDAIVLASSLTGETPRSLVDQAAAIDPVGEHIVALVVPEDGGAGPRGLASRWLRRPAQAAA